MINTSIKSFFGKAATQPGQGKKAVIKSQLSVERVEQINRLSEQLSPKCSSKSHRMALHSYLNMATDEQLATIEKISGVSEIMSNVQNVAKFVRGIMTLNGDVYGTVDMGERRLGARGMLMFRDALAQHVNHDSIRSERAILVAWSLWKDASADVYLEESRIAAYFRLAGLDPEEAMSHLKRHPSIPGMYTLPSIETQQKNVDWMLATSSIVSSAVLPGFEAIGDLDEVQAHAVKNALNKPVSFLHGSAGTGKTKTISAIIKTILDCMDDDVTMVCTAFTHKAFKCIEERIVTSDIPLEEVVTCTIDSLIGKLDMENMNKDTGTSTSSQSSFSMAMQPKKPIFSEKLYIVLDEASMISLKLLSRLAVSLRTNGKSFQLCMVGDIGQLRPIDRGEMFRYMIKSCEDINSKLSTRLDVCYRTSFFDLYNACTQVRNGSFPECSSEHFQLLACQDEDEITKNLVKCIKAHGTSAQYLAWKNEDVVMISNMVQKWLLTCKNKPLDSIVLDTSDAYVQRHYLPRGGYADVKYHVGDRVVFSGNKYKEVSRATLGTVTRILKKGKDSVGIAVLWDGHGNEMDHRYDKINVTAPSKNNTVISGDHEDDSDESDNNMAFMLAYCMTVHKSQGSEFQRVIVPCYAMGTQRNFEDRRWLYTAMSRGKENITVIGIPKDMIAFTMKPVPNVPALNVATPI